MEKRLENRYVLFAHKAAADPIKFTVETTSPSLDKETPLASPLAEEGHCLFCSE